MIEVYREIGHNSVMSIRGLFINIYEPAHLVEQVINCIEVIGDTSAEGANYMVHELIANKKRQYKSM